MASSASPSSCTTHGEEYDVFLSFRGEDTRNNFTTYLYDALCQGKIKTFIDERLNRGDEISSSLRNAIKASKISVIIFSKDYASSRWCLQELEQILECKNKDGQLAIPVFYHVDPSDVKNQKGSFGDGFAKLEERFKEESDMLKRWRSALEETANLSGWTIDDKQPECSFLKKTLNDIKEKLNQLSPADTKKLAGVDSAIQEVESLLRIGSVDSCNIVGIWGIGGIGKTTIARAVFNRILNQFEAYYFAENVREEWEKQSSLSQLREKLLSTLLQDRYHNIGLTFTKERLKKMKVLIVFDDVPSLMQIEHLIDLDCLSSRSRIIITGRDKKVLRACRVTDDNIYKVEKLSDYHAQQLFRRYAFEKEPPSQDYMELEKRILAYANGLPLALKVLGSSLLSEETKIWEDTIQQLELSGPPYHEIHKVLEVSYNGLEETQKNIFLDIACFFKGHHEEEVIKNLKAHYKFSIEVRIKVLIDRSLITRSPGGKITMHDLLQEMGRKIAREEYNKHDHGKQIRIWHHEDLNGILEENQDLGTIRSISLDISRLSTAVPLAKMRNLRFLRVYNSQPRSKDDEDDFSNKWADFEDHLEPFFTKLTYFSWHEYPFKSLPTSKFCVENLVTLDMPFNNCKQLWHGVQNVVNLKSIDLSFSKHLTEIPNLSRASSLESLRLSECTSLSSLPDNIPSTSIYLDGCSNLKIAPKISWKVQHLDLTSTAIEESPFIEHPSSLVELDLSDCRMLKSLSSSICKLKFLETLYLVSCSKLERLPDKFGDLESLVILEAKGTAFREVPSSILHLNKIYELCLSRVFDPDLPMNWVPMNWVMNSSSGSTTLECLYLNNCRMTSLPDNLGQLSSLEFLELEGNNFESLPSSIKDLRNLRCLKMSKCEMIKSLPELPVGLGLQAQKCSSLESISDPSFRLADFSGCFKLDIREVIRKVSPQRFGADIYFSGDIPYWFSFQNAGSRIECKQLPEYHNKRKFLGFSVCVTFARTGSTSPKIGYVCLIKSGDDRIEANEGYLGNGSFASRHGDPIGSDTVVLGFRKMGRLCRISNPPDEEYESYMEKMGSNNVLFELKKPFDSRWVVNKCGVHFLYEEGSDKEEEEVKPRLVRLKISNALEDGSYSSLIPRDELWDTTNFPCDMKYLREHSWKHKRNAVRDILRDGLLNVQQNTVVWSKVEEITCENPKGCMCFPGREIPTCFNIQNDGNTIELPQDSFNHNFVSLAFCTVVACPLYMDNIEDFFVNCEFYVKSQDMHFSEKVAIGSIRCSFEVDRYYCSMEPYYVFVGYDCVICTQEFRKLSYNKEVSIDFSAINDSIGYNLPRVKKCGIRLIYDEDFGKPMEGSNSKICFVPNEEQELENQSRRDSRVQISLQGNPAQENQTMVNLANWFCWI